MKKVLVLVVSVVTAGVVGYFLALRLVKIKNVECVSNLGECPAELGIERGIVYGKSLASSKRRMGKFLDESVAVSDYRIKYRFPSTLEVYVVFRRAEVEIVISGESTRLYVDGAGVVVGSGEEAGLPVLNIESGSGELTLEIGERLADQLIYGVELLDGLGRLYGINNVSMKGEYYEASVEGYRVLMPGQGDVGQLLGKLSVIVSGLNDKAQKTTIDLRFDDPVIR